MNSPRALQAWPALPAFVCSVTHVWQQSVLRTPPSQHSQLGWRAGNKNPAGRGEAAPQMSKERGDTAPATSSCHPHLATVDVDMKSLLDPQSLVLRPSQSHFCVAQSYLFLPGSYFAPIGRAKEAHGNLVGPEVRSGGDR